MAPLGAAADALPAVFLRTKSAQDFGAGLGGGVFGASTASSVVCVPSVSTTGASPSAGAACAELCVSTAGACCLSTAGGEALGLAMPGMLGTAIAVLVSRRACWDCVGVVFGDGAFACAGVTGVEALVASLSDGACEVAGVSCSDGGATVEASEGGARTVSSSASSTTVSFAGNATPCTSRIFCLRRLLPAARGGKAALPPS